MTGKTLALAYAVGGYIVGMGSLVYLIGFLADFGVPKGISDGTPTTVWFAVLVDVGLIGLFGLHHSVTARTSFKRWWLTIIAPAIERATYLYMTAVMTAVLVVFWRPIPVTIWEVQSTWMAALIYIAYLATWAMMLAATFQLGHLRFFGLTQAWQNFRNTRPEPSSMTARYLYALVRHPISLGWMITPLLMPHLTVGHLVFAVATLAYILAATPFEEADLIEDLGDSYRDYKNRVPAFIPTFRK